MKALSLLFHDVIGNGQYDESGFAGLPAARYKLNSQEFELHVQSIANSCQSKPILISELPRSRNGELPLLLTFDDGGVSAYTYVAEILEAYDWRGHFFITADYIGRPGFLSTDQIRALRKRGHVIGTHSCSHPERMSHLSWDAMVNEWERSIRLLSDIIGEPIHFGSVPGGHFSTKVAQAASACGIKALFTSEPIVRIYQVNDCLILGRFTLLRGVSAGISGKLVGGNLVVRSRCTLQWNARKVAKILLGRSYLKLRKYILGRM